MTGGNKVWTFPLSSLLRIQAGPTPGDFSFFSFRDGKNENLNLIKQIHRTWIERNMKAQFCVQACEEKITSEWAGHILWLLEWLLSMCVCVSVCVCVCVCVCGVGAVIFWLTNWFQNFHKEAIFCYQIGRKNVSNDVYRRKLLFMKWVTVTLLLTWGLCQESLLCPQLPNRTYFRVQPVCLPWSFHHAAFSPFSGPAQHLLSVPLIKHKLPCFPGIVSIFRLHLVYTSLPFLEAVTPSILLFHKHKLDLSFNSLECKF